MASIKETIRNNNAYYCVDCGKCTSICPVADAGHSPRLAVKKCLTSGRKDVSDYQFFWSCLTCKACNELCPSDVSYAEMTAEVRVLARGLGSAAECTHSGAMDALERIMTAPNLAQNRMGWITEGLRISSKADIVYFTGCLPYLDTFFEKFDLKLTDIGRSAVRILNKLGIEPAVMKDERCCGHDLLWTGQVESFKKLVKHNVGLLNETGAKTIVSSCAECYKTLKQDYPRYSPAFKFEVLHLSQLLAKDKYAGRLAFDKKPARVTYHDACRLGRFCSVFDEPRAVMNAAGGLELREMEHSGRRALCCGTVSWINCGSINKEVQIQRLKEARATGAEILVTTCPKCQIHFKCAMKGDDRGKEVSMKMIDLACLIDEKTK